MMQSGTLLFFYFMQQCYVQYEMQELIHSKKANQEKLLLTEATFNEGIINNHEICIEGKMYDIISRIKKGSKIEIIAIHDVKEEIIVMSIKSAIGINPHHNKALPNPVTKMITMIFISPAELQQTQAIITDQLIYIDFSPAVSAPAVETTSPPPWFV